MQTQANANHSFAADFLVCYIHWREEPQMSLAEKIQKDLVDAMRAREELRLSVLRGIKAAIKHKEVEKMRALDERSEEHTSELQSRQYLVCRLLLEKKHIPV